jgi:hypothetical protein
VKKITDAFKTGVCTFLPSCRDASRLQSEALDKKLSVPRRIGLFLHLLICKWCRRYGRQIRFLREAAQEHPEHLAEAVPQRLSAEARERIKRRLETEK